jgi:hypothetical protein
MTASPLEKRQSGFSKLLGTAANAASIYGAVKKKASGGEVPYESNMSGRGLDIPEEDESSKKYDLMTPASVEKPESGLSKVGKIAQIAGTAAAIFSDKRMKENIKEIGKLFDGQIVHSFNYKGDPRTQIGLIAQEVEDHKPHAVGLAGGMKTVDYRKATSGAARRGHFAEGGMPQMPATSILASLRKDIDPRHSLFNVDPEQNSELQDEGRQSVAEADLPPIEPAEKKGLAAARSAGLPELLKEEGPSSMPKPAGLAPKAGALPKNIMQIARLIHAGEGTGQNPMSSAKGAYQMIDSTFAGQFRKQYPDRAMGMSDRDIIALKRSPEGAALSEAMGPKLIEGNARVIERGGFEPDAGNVYLAHFLGPDTAVKVLRASPNAPIANYVSEEAIMANPPLQKNPTVGGVIDWARGSMAKQAARLSRASGGLAGRNGYADGGVEEDPDMVARQLFETTEAPVEQAAPTGLAPADKPAAPAAPATPAPAQAAPEDNNFFRGLARGKATSVIPFLTGIGALGTARTVSPGVAIAAGLGAGAQAAQGQREFGRQLRETSAVEASVKAKQAQANADVAKAYIDTTGLPAKIAGWRQLAAKGGPDAALSIRTANELQRILDSARGALEGAPKGTGAPGAPPVAGAAPMPTEGAVNAPTAPAKPRTFGDINRDLEFKGLAGIPTAATEVEQELASKGFRIGPSGNFEPDPTFVSTRANVEGPFQRQTGNITADVGAGKTTFDVAMAESRRYENASPLISALTSLPKDTSPTAPAFSRVANMLGSVFGYTPDQMESMFGKQPSINSILNAAKSEGIDVDPSLGVAGVNMLIEGLNQKRKIASVRAKAAEKYRQAKGYDGGMEAFITDTLRLYKLIP